MKNIFNVLKISGLALCITAGVVTGASVALAADRTTPPTVTAVSPTSVKPGDTITITGTNFATINDTVGAGSVVVHFVQASGATENSAGTAYTTSTSFSFPVPELAPGTLTLVVQNLFNDNTIGPASAPFSITILPRAAVLNSVCPFFANCATQGGRYAPNETVNAWLSSVGGIATVHADYINSDRTWTALVDDSHEAPLIFGQCEYTGQTCFTIPAGLSVGTHLVSLNNYGLKSNTFPITITDKPVLYELGATSGSAGSRIGVYLVTQTSGTPAIVFDGNVNAVVHPDMGSATKWAGVFQVPGTLSVGSHTIQAITDAGALSDPVTFTVTTGTATPTPGSCASSGLPCPTSTTSGGSTPPPTPLPPTPAPAPDTGTNTPAISLTASAATVATGDFVTLTWSATNANSCSAEGAWYGEKKVSGSEKLRVNTSGTRTYGLKCTGPNGSSQARVQVKSKRGAIVTPTPVTATVSGKDVGAKNKIEHNLKIGSRDNNNDNDVEKLQMFLKDKGYLSTNPTGYFGNLTLQAVKKFQQDNGIPVLGSVGPVTRGKINTLSYGSGFQTPLAPVISIAASPTTVAVGQSTKITWSVANATNGCVKSGEWSGNEEGSGSATVGPLSAGTHTYTLTCTGGLGKTSSKTLLVNAGSASGGLTAVGETVITPGLILDSDAPVYMNVSSADSCRISGEKDSAAWPDGSWTGPNLPTDTINVKFARFKSPGNYRLFKICKGPQGSTIAEHDFWVKAPLNPPTLDVSFSPIYAMDPADPQYMALPGFVTVTWSSTNATACTMNEPGAGPLAPSGTGQIYLGDSGAPFGYDNTYTIICMRPTTKDAFGNTQWDMMTRLVSVPTVLAKSMELTLSASPNPVPSSVGKTTVTWATTKVGNLSPDCEINGNYLQGISGSVDIPVRVGDNKVTLRCSVRAHYNSEPAPLNDNLPRYREMTKSITVVAN